MSKILCILDGLGLAPKNPNNAAAMANMPNFRQIIKNHFWTTLNADGEYSGQEAGLVGNSEVGHMNLGGLKLVPQLSYQITQSAKKAYDLDTAISPDQLFDPKVFLQSRFNLPKSSKIVHLAGLFSTGKIHSDLRHWAGAIEAAGKAGAEKIYLHLISDGRDSDRQSLVATWQYFNSRLSSQFEQYKDIIYFGGIGGRFYAMDRDKNWDRVQSFINVFTNKSSNPNVKYEDVEKILIEIVKPSYTNQVYDEHLESMTLRSAKSGDTVWFLNFRTDRMKQVTQMLCDVNDAYNFDLTILGMNDYGIGRELYLESDTTSITKGQSGYYPMFKNKPVEHTLAQTISESGKTQLHIAETEKYNHVTYFFNGGQNKKWGGEDWVVIDSNKVHSHAEKPEMKAKEITDYILEHGLGTYDYIIVNYANPDMVGHTGDISASVKAMECLDKELGRLANAVIDGGHTLVITADHGNIEMVGDYEIDGKQLVDTEHNANLVPLIIVDKSFNSAQMIEKLKETKAKHDLPLDLEVVASLFSQTNSLDLSDQEKWFTESQIPAAIAPLWYAGAITLCE